MRADQPTVRVGQVWRSTDPREHDRRIVIEELSTSIMSREPIAHARTLVDRNGDKTGRRTRIAVRRLRPGSTGYEMVEEAPDVR